LGGGRDAQPQLRGIVGLNGGGIAGKDERPNCPVQMHLGEKDASIPMTDVWAVRAPSRRRTYVYGRGSRLRLRQRGSFSQPDYELAQKRRWISSPGCWADPPHAPITIGACLTDRESAEPNGRRRVLLGQSRSTKCVTESAATIG
jgi:hypothetical protein